MYTFGKAASIIQNLYRSNKKRRAINIYKKLPQDLQNKILFIMQENDLIKNHHHDVIETILIKRFNNSRIKRAEILFNLATTTELASGLINNANKISIENYLDDLYQFLKLVIKYNDVTSYELHDAILTELASIEEYILYDILLELEDLHEYYVNTIGKLTRFYVDIYWSREANIRGTQIYAIYSEQIKNFSNRTGLNCR